MSDADKHEDQHIYTPSRFTIERSTGTSFLRENPFAFRSAGVFFSFPTLSFPSCCCFSPSPLGLRLSAARFAEKNDDLRGEPQLRPGIDERGTCNPDDRVTINVHGIQRVERLPEMPTYIFGGWIQKQGKPRLATSSTSRGCA